MDVEKLIREYIEPLIHMSLATTRENKPWVCEVHFAYDENLNLYFRSLTSRRHSQDIAMNPNVAGNIVRQYGLGESPVGVYFEGTAELLGPGDEQTRAAKRINDRIDAGDDILEQAKNPDGHQFYKIIVENWYAFGRFSAPSGQKYKLEWNGNIK